MNFQLISDLRDAIKECLEVDCEYNFFVSLGKPPADCNSIAFWYDGSRRNKSDNSECRTNVLDSDITITITRCCISADAELVFDFRQEEKDAQCFLDDLEALVQCLVCNSNILDDQILGCGVSIQNIDVDAEKLGGCYSADIELSFTEEVCCD